MTLQFALIVLMVYFILLSVLSSNILIQWIHSAKDIIITYPISFSKFCAPIVSHDGGNFGIALGTHTLTQISHICYGWGGNYGPGSNGYTIAIGY